MNLQEFIFWKFSSSVINIEHPIIGNFLYNVFKYWYSDINIDWYPMDIILITARKWNDYKQLVLYNTYNMTKEKEKIIDYYKQNNFKIYELKDKSLLKYLIVFIKDLYLLYKQEVLNNNETWLLNELQNISTNNDQNIGFVRWLQKKSKEDTSCYIGKINIWKEIIDLGLNLRLNVHMSNRRIFDDIVTKVFTITARAIYTNLNFEDVIKNMISVKKLNDMIKYFLFYELYERFEDKKKYKQVFGWFINGILPSIGMELTNDQKIILNELLEQKIKWQELTKYDILNIFDPSLIEKDLLNKLLVTLNSGSWLWLVSWPTGSWKTTLLFTMLQEGLQKINKTVISIEDPIEYLLSSPKSLIYQKEVWKDVKSFIAGLKDALRQKPDIIVLGEIRENEDENIAKILMEAAKTGHLVLWTIHAKNLFTTISRLKELSKTNELLISYLINIRRLKTLDNKFITVYEQYLRNKNRSDQQNLAELQEIQSKILWINYKLIFLYLIRKIDLNTVITKSTDIDLILKVITSLANKYYIHESWLFPKEEVEFLQNFKK